MKHTPGPWAAEIINEPGIGDRVYGIKATSGTQIVETDSGYYPPNIHDARLIAAAPEMYDLLTALVLIVDANGDRREVSDAWPLWQIQRMASKLLPKIDGAT